MDADDVLLDAWRSGNRRAGEDLLHRHFDAIHRFFSNKVDSAADAEDLIQRTFEACLGARDRFEGRAMFRTFLFGIARNVLRDHYRRRAPDVEIDFESASAIDLGGGPSTLLARRQEQRLLLQALRSIPMALQVVLELHFWEKMTGPEIGEVLGIPLNTAYSRLRRARESLDAALAALAESPELLASTTGDLERWAMAIHREVGT